MCLMHRSSSVPLGYSGITSKNSSAPFAAGTTAWSMSGMMLGCLSDVCTLISQCAASLCSGSCARTFLSANRSVPLSTKYTKLKPPSASMRTTRSDLSFTLSVEVVQDTEQQSESSQE